MKNFDGFGLNPALCTSLTKMGYTAPTPIQQKAIPFALDGRDVLGSAQTGTGKTAAFGIPLVEAIMNSDSACALVLTPTRELASQVMEVITQLLGHGSDINTAFLIGGASMDKQMQQLKRNPRIIVGTPGRINDHLDRRTVKLNNTSFLVLDETDRMLDMGFGVQIDKILSFMPKERQTLMFSATLPKEIIQMSGKYLTNPERISMGDTNVIATNIKQETMRIEQGAKYQEMVTQLYERNGSVIIFVKTKYGTERMAKNLRRDGFEADALHGDLRQRTRDKVMDKFRNKKFRILVATDIAARGLDVPHIEHVINHDLPQVAEDYIHRMGRTARAGATGSALSLISPQEVNKWNAIERLLDPNKKVSNDRNEGKKKKPRRSNGSNAGKSFGKKPYEKKSFEKKAFGKKPFEKKPFAKKPRNEEGASSDYSEKSESNFKDRGYDARKDTRKDNPNRAGSKKKTFDSNKKFDKSAEKPRSKSGGKPFGKKKEEGAPSKSFGKPNSNKSGKPFGKSSGKPSGKPSEASSGKPSKRPFNKNAKTGGFKSKSRAA